MIKFILIIFTAMLILVSGSGCSGGAIGGIGFGGGKSTFESSGGTTSYGGYGGEVSFDGMGTY